MKSKASHPVSPKPQIWINSISIYAFAGMSHAEGQQGGSCAGYVLAHDPEERPDAGAPSRRAEGTSVELCDKKGDCSPPFTSKGYVQCSAITERLDSFQ